MENNPFRCLIYTNYITKEQLKPYFEKTSDELLVIIQNEFQYLEQFERILLDLYSLQRPFFKFNILFANNHGPINENLFDLVLHLNNEVLEFQVENKLVRENFKRAANGGTFDYLHNGHKILLSISLLAVSNHLTIGITGEELLQKKKNKEFIQSYDTRQLCVKEFCSLFKPKIDIYLAKLVEPAGPTKDGEYEGIILTKETESAKDYINNLRIQNNLNQLDSYTINMIVENEQKLSSTQLRELICQTISKDDFLKLKSLYKKQYLFESLIVPYYSQPQRKYHTLQHLVQIFKLADKINDTQLNTIFFHDIVYYPKRNDNEEKSIEAMKQANVQDAKAELYILSTKKHIPLIDDDDDLKYFLDLDLSILESDNYEQYTQQIRQEYIHIDDQNFKIGRKKVLER
ncbi:hypothetical protein pb186bvf_006815 [Paramecium bursaria]